MCVTVCVCVRVTVCVCVCCMCVCDCVCVCVTSGRERQHQMRRPACLQQMTAPLGETAADELLDVSANYQPPNSAHFEDAEDARQHATGVARPPLHPAKESHSNLSPLNDEKRSSPSSFHFVFPSRVPLTHTHTLTHPLQHTHTLALSFSQEEVSVTRSST